MGQTITRRERAADSPLIERITQVAYEERTQEWVTPDGCWDIVIFQKPGGTMVFQTGLTTRPVRVENGAGDSFLTISFKPGVFMPRTPGFRTVDTGLVRPLVSSRAFAIDSETFEIPTFENAEQFVTRLVRREVLVRDDLVASALEGRPRAITTRSMQRHFLSALGMTPKQFPQVQRAMHAVDMLRRGIAPAAVATDAGYSDQPHLTRSLKAIMGQTPGQIVRGA
jgi:hypothetical protein